MAGNDSDGDAAMIDSPRPPTSSPNHQASDAAIAGASQSQPEQQRRYNNIRRRRPYTDEQQEQQGMVIDHIAVKVRRNFERFLENYIDDNGEKYYVRELDTMEENESTTIRINWHHLSPESMSINTGYQQLADFIISDYYRYEPYLRQAVCNFVKNHKPNYVKNDDSNQGENKEFYIAIYNFSNHFKLRELNTSKIGQLCVFSATVTRTTEVRPELIHGTFICGECGNRMRNISQQFKYSEPQICSDIQCQNRRVWELDVNQSKFVDWQKCRVQENSVDIPPGSMPRSMDVILRNECCERCKPGDNASFTGTLIVVPDVGQYYSKSTKMVRNTQSSGPNQGVTGIRALGVRELNYRLVFLANNVVPHLKQFGYSDIRGDDEDEDVVESFTVNQREDILKMKGMQNLYERMAQSIAPNIYGHEEIKRGILLMLFGGCKKNTKDGVSLRGDINICIIGDPSTAKSQFLKYVTKILPRTIYTSGKASTSAGLTAAVMKDPETGEFGIEAGALMLADNGICCIDEFDKMDAIDQAAIHEAMEQQTITITKAGIQATLNAKASILAAANPIFGRYDTTKPMRYNVTLSAPIMSRFDLFFIVLDECDEVTDYHVAKHIVNVHKNIGVMPNNESSNKAEFSIERIQRYIRYARTLQPLISAEAKKYLVRFYRQLRQRDQSDQKAYRFTVRQLESLIRLSEALARLHLDSNVTPKYVIEAARLLKKSIISVDAEEITLDEPKDDAMVMDIDAKDDKEDEKDDEKKEDEKEEVEQKEDESISISYNVYMNTANMIVYVIRKNEEKEQMGLKQSRIEYLVMKEKESIIGDEEQIQKEMKILRFIIHRLIETDHILLIKQNAEQDINRVLMVHPNYDPDSRNTENLDVDQQEQGEEQKEEEKEDQNENDDIDIDMDDNDENVQ